jgi:hypothetical protein
VFMRYINDPTVAAYSNPYTCCRSICEYNWKNIRKLAFAFMNDAQVDLSFFPMALEHAWKVYASLPHTALTMEKGDTQSPHLVYFGKPARVADFKVLFCPVIMNYLILSCRAAARGTLNKHPSRTAGRSTCQRSKETTTVADALAAARQDRKAVKQQLAVSMMKQQTTYV